MASPVYVFTGFLESGKTKFIQETFEDPRFEDGTRALLLVCEEGVEEYDPAKFAVKDFAIETIEDQADLTAEKLAEIGKRTQPEKIIIEYNGMWMLSALYAALPEDWVVYQQMLFVDATTFESYNANMRSLVVDKMNSCEMVAFNRVAPEQDVTVFHKLVRAISRRCDIAYEYRDGKVQYDDIEDPLPFDVNAPVIEIADRDYALWYRDMMDDMAKYDGKTVRFLGNVARDKKMQKNEFVLGRHVMTCCVQDITYAALVCLWEGAEGLKSRDWVTLTAKIKVEKHQIYKQVGPVLYAEKVETAQEPAEKVATFY